MRFSPKLTIGAAIALAIAPLATLAHVIDYGTISTDLDVHRSEVILQTEVSQNVNTYGMDPVQAEANFEKYFSSRLKISHNGIPCVFSLSYFDPSFEAPHSLFRGRYSCSGPIERLDQLSISSSAFEDAFLTFDHFLIITIGNDRYQLPFSTTNREFPENVQAQRLGSTIDYFLAITWQFIQKGVHHIWIGYDHILFLLCIILLSRNLKQILILVTTFTLAHSVTLILAGLGYVSLPARIVEPGIAATILFVAYRNIQALRHNKGAGTERAPLTFLFGLIHGLGFAGALAETSIPQIFFIPALITFNVGVELGQLAILLVAVPILWHIDKTAYRVRVLLAFSSIACVVSLWWLLVRILL